MNNKCDLVIRPFEKIDKENIMNNILIDNIYKCIGFDYFINNNDTRVFFNRVLSNNGIFVLEYDKNICGIISISNSILSGYENFSQVEIGFVLSKKYHHRGFMHHCLEMIIDYCFNHLNLELVWVEHLNDNNSTRRLLLECGFKMLKETQEERIIKYIILRK